MYVSMVTVDSQPIYVYIWCMMWVFLDYFFFMKFSLFYGREPLIGYLLLVRLVIHSDAIALKCSGWVHLVTCPNICEQTNFNESSSLANTNKPNRSMRNISSRTFLLFLTSS
jgi:hypothetical protein